MRLCVIKDVEYEATREEMAVLIGAALTRFGDGAPVNLALCGIWLLLVQESAGDEDLTEPGSSPIEPGQSVSGWLADQRDRNGERLRVIGVVATAADGVSLLEADGAFGD